MSADDMPPILKDLLIIDELGFVPLSKTGVELLFEVISQSYERGSIIITSNLPFSPPSAQQGSPAPTSSSSTEAPRAPPRRGLGLAS